MADLQKCLVGLRCAEEPRALSSQESRSSGVRILSSKSVVTQCGQREVDGVSGRVNTALTL